jgi:uncharacterized membrane protein
MTTGRLEAFSDGVFAIIITIMVLDLHVPAVNDVSGLLDLAPTFGSYALSYVFVGIYWSNHHHLFHAAERLDGRTLWANLHLLFWLSLVPFATRWMREQDFAVAPVMAYGVVMWASGASFYLVGRSLVRLNGGSALAAAIGEAMKERASMALYTLALIVAVFAPLVAVALYALVALLWLAPDRRIEAVFRAS